MSKETSLKNYSILKKIYTILLTITHIISISLIIDTHNIYIYVIDKYKPQINRLFPLSRFSKNDLIFFLYEKFTNYIKFKNTIKNTIFI